MSITAAPIVTHGYETTLSINQDGVYFGLKHGTVLPVDGGYSCR